MSRDFSHNQTPLSPTERSNSVNITEITNMQSQNNEKHNQTYQSQDLSQTAQAFNEMKANYEELIGKFSNSPLSSGSGSGSSNSNNFLPNKSYQTYIGDISSNFLVDENAELEVQQWGIMWTHLVSMITQVIPYQQTNLSIPKSGNEKRAILVDLVSKLCENATNPKVVEDYEFLKKKYQKNKKSLKKLREQGETLMIEVKKNKELLNQHLEKFGQNDESKLNQKIKQLEELLKKQVQGQAELLSMDLQQQSNKGNLKKYSSANAQTQIQDLQLNVINQDDIFVEEEEEDVEVVVQDEAQNLAKIVSNQVKIENRNPPKRHDKEKRHHKSHQKKEIQYEYEVEYSDDNNNDYNYDYNSEPEHKSIQQARKVHRKQKQEIVKNKKAKAHLDQNKKHASKQLRAQTQIQINNDDLFTSSSSSFSVEESEIKNKRSFTKSQKSKKAQSSSKMRQASSNIDNDDIQRNQKLQTKFQTKSTKSEHKTEKIKFQKNDIESDEFENNNELINNSKKRKRRASPNIHMRKAYGDINQLVDVTNNLKRDYNRLRKALGEEPSNDMSIEQLSRINDSLMSVENQLDNS